MMKGEKTDLTLSLSRLDFAIRQKTGKTGEIIIGGLYVIKNYNIKQSCATVL